MKFHGYEMSGWWRAAVLSCALAGCTRGAGAAGAAGGRVDGADWFPFTPHGGPQPTVAGMESWMDAPAGKHGGVRIVGDHLEFSGTPAKAVKFWGTNLSYKACAPERENAELTARRFARYGVNAVRLHKFSGAGWEGIGDANDATRFDAEGLGKLDFFASRLTVNGVYYGFSHTYHFRPKAANKGRLIAYDEIEKNLKGDTYGLINFADDLQDLLIEMVVGLLKHRNPYTGKTYAEDPALAYIELQNEDDIFFYTSEPALKACPTYARRTSEKFSAWLMARYGSEPKWREAWGNAVKGGESLAGKNVAVQANPWFMSDENLPRIGPGEKRRMMDNAAFFYALQNAFYDKYVKAIRAAGYKGPLVGSPWQAPMSVPHYYNLKSDALVGIVDRHNYFGERAGDSMLGQVGSGLVSTGLQQVADRPFALSEWIMPYPTLYGAEGPVLVAAYGMGLQGWSASYEFNSDSGSGGAAGFATDAGHPPWAIWNVDVPTQMGQFLTLSRMVLRGDVQEGEVVAVRKVSMEELEQGRLGFAERMSQRGDVKSFGGNGGAEALAAGRCLVQFTEKPEASVFPEMEKFRKGAAVVSSTGQLTWDPGNGSAGSGGVTINTAGTKGFVGFAKGKELALGKVTITPRAPFASVVVTALGRGETLESASSALVSAVARNVNKGFSYQAGAGENGKDKVVEAGTGPIMIEPVKVGLKFAGRPVKRVNVLDFDGRRTGRTVPVEKGVCELDTGKEKAIYFEVEFGS